MGTAEEYLIIHVIGFRLLYLPHIWMAYRWTFHAFCVVDCRLLLLLYVLLPKKGEGGMPRGTQKIQRNLSSKIKDARF